MKSLIKHLACLLMVMFACVSLTSCGDDEPGKITLSKGESSKVTVAANTSSGSINFTAAAPWSAYTSAQSRSSDGVDWIHLGTTNGSAGEVSLTFTLDSNTTGSKRTAYIIIVCDDETLTITITQTSETGSDEDGDDYASNVELGVVEIEVETYTDGSNGYESQDFYSCRLEYLNGRPYRMVRESRDELYECASEPATVTRADSYCITQETAEFSWGSDFQSVMVTIQINETDYPSGNTEIRERSQHYAEFKDGRAVKGWYKLEWDRDEDRTDWEATYDNAGYLVSTKNNDWDSYDGYCDTYDKTHTFSWKDGCLEKIVSPTDQRIVFTYADSGLKNLHSTFDLSWVLPTHSDIYNFEPRDIDRYDFAAGDITRVFAAAGLMGNPSDLLLTATGYATEESERPYSFSMDYKENTLDRTVVTVTRHYADFATDYQEWTINYYNIK